MKAADTGNLSAISACSMTDNEERKVGQWKTVWTPPSRAERSLSSSEQTLWKIATSVLSAERKKIEQTALQKMVDPYPLHLWQLRWFLVPVELRPCYGRQLLRYGFPPWFRQSMNKAAKVSVQNDAQDGKKAAATKGRGKHIHMQARRPISTCFHTLKLSYGLRSKWPVSLLLSSLLKTIVWSQTIFFETLRSKKILKPEKAEPKASCRSSLSRNHSSSHWNDPPFRKSHRQETPNSVEGRKSMYLIEATAAMEQ